ncbi:MAG TPA: transposase [Acidimicrobiales bacterium]|nr:transposase [Acidimicrobiales bacterium]
MARSHPPGTIVSVISSREKARRYGPGWLLVDGTDETIIRKAEFSLRPSKRQAGLLAALLGACCEVYNAGLQERRDAWRMAGKSIALFDQFNQIASLRGVRDDVLAWGIQPLRGTLRRLDEAYGAFYRRCAAGQTPGHPRFKGRRRFDTVCWDEPTSWSVNLEQGVLRLQGVGNVALSKSARRQLARLAVRGGVAVTLTITRGRSGNSWRACVGYKGVAAAKTAPAGGAEALVGADRGVTVTVALSDGQLLVMPTFLGEAGDRIAELQRQRATKKKGSVAWKALNRQVAKAYRQARHRSDNWARETARQLIYRYSVVVLEDLKLTNMMASASGTLEQPGTNVAAKQALNRKLAEAALGRLRHWICVKAEEAGRRVWVVPAKNTSRRCAACGHTAKANRDGPLFVCGGCGHTNHADLNAAENIASLGHDCETAWDQAGRPPMVRPKPRFRRRKADGTAAPESALAA